MRTPVVPPPWSGAQVMCTMRASALLEASQERVMLLSVAVCATLLTGSGAVVSGGVLVVTVAVALSALLPAASATRTVNT